MQTENLFQTFSSENRKIESWHHWRKRKIQQSGKISLQNDDGEIEKEGKLLDELFVQQPSGVFPCCAVVN